VTAVVPEVLVDRDGAVLVITINRPEQRNAMTRTVGEMIAAAVDRLDSDSSLSVGVLADASGRSVRAWTCSDSLVRATYVPHTASIHGQVVPGLAYRRQDNLCPWRQVSLNHCRTAESVYSPRRRNVEELSSEVLTLMVRLARRS
jgi:1,4-dihydroxy-2-naphthoyl-CoA synthase